MRGGAPIEHALRRVVKDIPIGKVLIRHHTGTWEPSLHYMKLPKCLGESWVIVADDQIATGADAMMAIRILLDHQVPQDRILYLALLASPLGLSNVANAFPGVRIITAGISEYELEDGPYIKSGFGNLADRYFGTGDF